jgi:hypothetical protein
MTTHWEGKLAHNQTPSHVLAKALGPRWKWEIAERPLFGGMLADVGQKKQQIYLQ